MPPAFFYVVVGIGYFSLGIFGWLCWPELLAIVRCSITFADVSKDFWFLVIMASITFL
jgi:hypothetical protein